MLGRLGDRVRAKSASRSMCSARASSKATAGLRKTRTCRPDGSVAVAVTHWPVVVAARVAEKLAVPEAFVVTDMAQVVRPGP